MKKLLFLSALIFFSCQTKEEKAISSFKAEINNELVKYNSYINNFKNSLENLRIKEFDVIANDSIPSEYSKSLNDYWMLESNNEDILQNINNVERNISIADSISTKIITLNDSLVKYNVSDSLINLKFSEIKDNNKKFLQVKYYKSEAKRLLKLKDDFYNIIENIVVDGGWSTTGYLMNKKSSMKFYKHEEGHRFMVRYGGLIIDRNYNYKEKTGEEVYDLSNPRVFLSNTGKDDEFVNYINVLEWRATGFSSSANGGRISFDKNFGKGSKLQITLRDENGKKTNYGNYIRYWFGDDDNSYYGTYKLEGKQKDIVKDFFRLNYEESMAAENIENVNRYAKDWGLDLEQLDEMEESELMNLFDKNVFLPWAVQQQMVEMFLSRNIIKLVEDEKIIVNELGEDYYNLEFKAVDLNEFINDFTNDFESNKGSIQISYNETNYQGEIIVSNIDIGENNEIKSNSDKSLNGKIDSIEVVTTSIGKLYKFDYTYEHEDTFLNVGIEKRNANMYILSGGSVNHSYVWTSGITFSTPSGDVRGGIIASKIY